MVAVSSQGKAMQKLSYPFVGRSVLNRILDEIRPLIGKEKTGLVQGELVSHGTPISWMFIGVDRGLGKLRLSYDSGGRARSQYLKLDLVTGEVISRTGWLLNRRMQQNARK